MSQEKTSRNRKIYLDKIKVVNDQETTWRKLSKDWGLAVSVLQTIVAREHNKTLKQL